MRFLLAPDKFKLSLSAEEVIGAIELGLRRLTVDVETVPVLVSDGGDGFLASIKKHLPDVEEIQFETSDALGRKLDCPVLFTQASDSWPSNEQGPNTRNSDLAWRNLFGHPQTIPQSTTTAPRSVAFVEMAMASGMATLTPDERNPMNTSSAGTGKLIRSAIEHGATDIFVGVGGSATNDAGIGLAAALGYTFQDQNQHDLEPSASNLGLIKYIKSDEVFSPQLERCNVYLVHDVTNPLLGPSGATHVYGPQKGATDAMVAELERGIRNISEVVEAHFKSAFCQAAGAGAAGGVGFGLMAFANAKPIAGVNFLFQISGIERMHRETPFDWIITGEGKMDSQTLFGKLVYGVAQFASRHEIPVVAICGQVDLTKAQVESLGLRDAIAIHNPERTVADTIKESNKLIAQEIEQFFTRIPQ